MSYQTAVTIDGVTSHQFHSTFRMALDHVIIFLGSPYAPSGKMSGASIMDINTGVIVLRYNPRGLSEDRS